MPRLRSINRFLSWSVGLLAVYILLAPLLPAVASFLTRWTDPTGGYRYRSHLANAAGARDAALSPAPHDRNVLVLPQIGVDAEILEGSSVDVLRRGLWRRPRSGNPERGGNTVITGHRFLYTNGPNTFYALDKMRVGDRFLIFWNGQEYNYEVDDIRTVPPERVEIERPTHEDVVTLYTCTPLWTSKNRLVVRAKRVLLSAAASDT